MMQRFGISLNSTKHRELVSKIKAHNGAGVQNGIEFVKRLSNARTLWRIEYEGQIILVVYDKNNTSIITALYDTGEPELNNELERLP